MADEGNEGARDALDLVSNPNQLLSTVQTGITLVSILAGAFGGATMANELASNFSDNPYLGDYSDMVSFFITVLLITFFNLVLGELVPKRLALNNPERFASKMAPPMRTFSRIVSPIIILLSFSTDLVLRLMKVKSYAEPVLTEEEIRIMIDQGTTAGVIEEEEQEIMERLFSLGDRKINSIMTPRGEIVWLDVDDPPEEIQRKITGVLYSLFPVCQGSLDNILGIVQSKDLLFYRLKDSNVDLKTIILPPLFIPESMRALKVLERFKQTGIHLAIVLDEYGLVQGLVALVDILEGLVGDIPHIDDLAEPQIICREDGSYLADGNLPVEAFREAFKMEMLPEEENFLYQTLGGFMMMYLEKMPTTGDHFEWDGYRFEVVDMDERRVDKVLITPI
jgi:putative hemolysin